jgi:putative peptide zinc metalloprotease protein
MAAEVGSSEPAAPDGIRDAGQQTIFQRAQTLLRGTPAFATLPPKALTELAERLHEEHYPADSIVIREGEVGDRLYLIVEGRVEVSVAGPRGPVPLRTREPGEVFGEIALLMPGSRRMATVIALTPLRVLSLNAPALEHVLTAYPTARAALEAGAKAHLVFNFLKQASPFTTLPPERLEGLAAKLEVLAVPTGATIVRQDEPGDTCYLLRRGRVEVVAREEGGPERRLTTLGSGTIFGETALLTEAHRTATVRSLEPCELLVLRRADLLTALGDRGVGARMIEQMHLRDRPRQAPGILVQHRTTPEGETITILKDPRRGAYYRLSPQGLFVWQHLDGRHNLRDLTLAYLDAFKALALQAIAEVVGGLATAGFVEGVKLRADVQAVVFDLSWRERALLLARQVLNWQVFLPHVDRSLTGLYNTGVHWLYTGPAQGILAGLSLAGLATFVLIAGPASAALHAIPQSRLLVFLVPALVFSIIVHEAGHAFTTKAFGRQVLRVGLGWYWFTPIAFVDTSDMWLAERWPRIAVSLAGPYAQVVLAGLASLGAWLASTPVVTAGLWEFALVSYLWVLIALNPLLEYDGYYILMDLLERPNLRSRALPWLWRELPRAVRTPDGLKGHGVDLLYGFGSLAYVVLLAGLIIVCYRVLVQDWMLRVLPGSVATGLAWVFAAVVVAMAVVHVLNDVRGV